MAEEALVAEAAEGNEETGPEGVETDQYLVFVASGQEYGIQAMRVQEISAMVDITEVPKTPDYIEGILNLRGRLVSVINFRTRFGFDLKDHDEDTRIVIVEHAGYPIGLLVDSVEEVIRIPDERVQKLPESTTTTAGPDYITGVGMLENRLIILLDADRLLSQAEQRELDGGRPLPATLATLAAPPAQRKP